MSEIISWIGGILLGVACAFSYVTETQWNKAQELCKPNNGLSSYVSNLIGPPDITCKNGAEFTLKSDSK